MTSRLGYVLRFSW